MLSVGLASGWYKVLVMLWLVYTVTFIFCGARDETSCLMCTVWAAGDAGFRPAPTARNPKNKKKTRVAGGKKFKHYPLSYLSSMLRRPQKQHRQMVCLNIAVGPIQYASCPTSEHIHVPIREPIRALEALWRPFHPPKSMSGVWGVRQKPWDEQHAVFMKVLRLWYDRSTNSSGRSNGIH